MTISSIVPSSGTGSCSRKEFEAREISDFESVLARSVALPSLILRTAVAEPFACCDCCAAARPANESDAKQNTTMRFNLYLWKWLSRFSRREKNKLRESGCTFASAVLFSFSLQELVSNRLQGYRIPDVISGHLS